MDWSQAHTGPRARALTPLDLVEICWRMRSLQKATRVVRCGIYRTSAGFVEVRVGYSDDDLLRSQLTRDLEHARALAAALKSAVLAKGGFTEVL